MQPFSSILPEIQQILRRHTPTLDGWLMYDNCCSNPRVIKLLGLPPNIFLTRRFVYWIPAQGEPIKIAHFVDAELTSALPGILFIYSSWQELDAILKVNLQGVHKIAMEYSPYNRIPTISQVDAGTIEWIRDLKIKIFSSWSLLEPFVAKLTQTQMEMHRQASAVILQAMDGAWKLIQEKVKKKERLTELDIQNYLLHVLEKHSCITDHPPICAVGPHAASPHYAPTIQTNCEIGEGDLVLIDCWCKKKELHAHYADHTQVAFVGKNPPQNFVRAYKAVVEAQQGALAFLKDRIEKGVDVTGAEVDIQARTILT
ncbi:MAG: hypothetical protein JWO53_199, partial [Chlamydiia bacterium]|nr:hypothetical protein [Chlamydiia bacterium]